MEMIVPISDLGSLAEKLLSWVKDSDQYIILTHEGRAKGVLLDYEYYKGLLATLEEMSAPEARQKIRRAKEESSQGKRIPHEEIVNKFQEVLESK